MGYLELLPVILAAIAIFASARAFKNTTVGIDKVKLCLSMLTASLLIIAQTSWFTASVINGLFEDTSFADNIWTIFNTLAMIVLILNTSQKSSENETKKSSTC
jgi:hypothetical protein